MNMGSKFDLIKSKKKRKKETFVIVLKHLKVNTLLAFQIDEIKTLSFRF